MKKKLLIALLVVFTGSTAAPAFASKAEDNSKNGVAASPVDENSTAVKQMSDEEINCLVSRLDEIRDMDKKQLSKADKKALRKEVKDIKQTLAEQDYVMYISLTALLLIIILILIL